MRIKQHIPNAITCCNLLCGCLALLVSDNAYMALMFILLAALFDFFDGFAARALRAYSPIGKDLDSLADMISFGVAPAIVGFKYMKSLAATFLGDKDWLDCLFSDSAIISDKRGMILLFAACLLPLFIALFSALRLAKFNNDKRQTENFIGLATPACTILYVSMVALLRVKLAEASTLYLQGEGQTPISIWYLWLPAITAPILSYLLVSEIAMFSMKLKNLSWQDNSTRFIFLMIVVVEIAMTIIGNFSVPFMILSVITTYIIINILLALKPNKLRDK